ncbi:hypothetical protein GF367_01350 [Candidatus Woesearchaeota archaeon]|nr:hypothetical protein [Candidatus Woesearchaeota archaeon]
MDIFLWALIGGFALLILATLWNVLMAPKERKKPRSLYQHFMDKYGFTTNDDANTFNGFYQGKSVQITTSPLKAFIPVANPRGIHLLLEKGDKTAVDDLVDTPMEGLQEAVVKSNYPMLVTEMLDEQLINDLNNQPHYAFELRDGIMVRCPSLRKADELEELLRIGVRLAKALEQINYAYQK